MTRAIITIRNDHDRARAAHWAKQAPEMTRIEFKATKRTGAQNDLMWALLTEVATQIKHADRKYSADQWKILFLHAIGREVQFIPALDNSTFIPWGQSSSDLSKEEMTNLIEFILRAVSRCPSVGSWLGWFTRCSHQLVSRSNSQRMDGSPSCYTRKSINRAMAKQRLIARLVGCVGGKSSPIS